MGWEIREIVMHARLERHNSAGDVADDAAFERFNSELRALVDSDPDYRRIFNYSDRLELEPVGTTYSDEEKEERSHFG